jgi:hypothetical protein
VSRRLIVLALVAGLLFLLGAAQVTAAPDVAVGLGGNEPTAGAVNPLNPQNIAVAKCSLSVSTNFGQTWSAPTGPFTPPGYPRVGIGCDDVLTFDAQGRLFWVYLLRADWDADGNQDTLSVSSPRSTLTGAQIGNAVDLTGNWRRGWVERRQAVDRRGRRPRQPVRQQLYVVWTRLLGACNPPACAVLPIHQFERHVFRSGADPRPVRASSGRHTSPWRRTATSTPPITRHVGAATRRCS